MRYPIFTLSAQPANLFFADYPEDLERGSFLVVEETAEAIIVKVDRFSTIPFYYVVHQGRLYGATRFAALIESLPENFPRKLNHLAAVEFLRTNSMLGQRTLMAGIERVPHGHELIFSKQEGRAELKEYWRLPGDVADWDETNLLSQLRECFLAVVADHARRFDRVGMHLSGGMDSRQILAALLASGKKIQAFTYGVPQNIDLLIAGQLADKFGLSHHVSPWRSVEVFRDNFPAQFDLTDGMQALFHGHGVDVYPREAELVDTVLYGHFLDFFIQGHTYDGFFEIDRGFLTHQRLYEKFDGGPCSVMRGDSLEAFMLSRPLWGAFAESIRSEIARFDYMVPEKRYDALYFVHHGLRRLLPQPQAGAHFVDFFLPGLVADFFALSWSVPGRLRRDRRLQRSLLLALNEKVCRVPIVRDNIAIEYLSDDWSSRLAKRWHELMKRRSQDYRYNYDYYGVGLKRMADQQLYPWIKREVLGSGLRDLGFLADGYLELLFDQDQGFKDYVPINHYGALLTLCRFADTYLRR